jgi:hypothetical protein
LTLLALLILSFLVLSILSLTLLAFLVLTILLLSSLFPALLLLLLLLLCLFVASSLRGLSSLTFFTPVLSLFALALILLGALFSTTATTLGIGDAGCGHK